MFYKTQEEIMKNWDKSIAKPLCSVICYSYNHKDFIEQALDSFLEQETNFPFEIIIHDDFSTDGTDKIIKEYEKKYPKIIKAMYESENQYSKGKNGNYFVGTMHKMAGKYIAFCESDDYWNDVNKLQIQVDFLENDKEEKFVACYHHCDMIDSNGNKINTLCFSTKDGTRDDMQKLRIWLPYRCVCYRNVIDFFEPNLKYYLLEIFAGDLFLFTLLGKYGCVKFLPQIKPAVYRLHQGGIWTGLDKQEQSMVRIKSFMNFSFYYSKIGDYDLAGYFLMKSINHCMEVDSVKVNLKDLKPIIKQMLINGYLGNGSLKLAFYIAFPRFHLFIRSIENWVKQKKNKSNT